MTIQGKGNKNIQKTSLHKSIKKSKKEKERMAIFNGNIYKKLLVHM